MIEGVKALNFPTAHTSALARSRTVPRPYLLIDSSQLIYTTVRNLMTAQYYTAGTARRRPTNDNIELSPRAPSGKLA